MRTPAPADLEVATLGPCTIQSPMQRHWAQAGEMEIFVSDEDGILLDDSLASVSSALTRSERLLAFELAGPRRSIFFDPAIQGDLWHSLIEATGQSPKFF